VDAGGAINRRAIKMANSQFHMAPSDSTAGNKGVLVTLEHEDHGALRAAVATALGRNVTALREVRREPLDYDAFLAHRSVSRLRGSAIIDRTRSGGERIPWSMIEKRTEGPGLASPYLLANGRREFDAYASGVLDGIAPGIRAPRAYGTLLAPDGGITLWLEEVHHDGPRPLDARSILAAARDLGGMSGRWVGRELDQSWYFRGWIDRHAQPEAVVRGLAALRRAPRQAVAHLGERLALAEQLIREQPRVRAILESLPHTLCHHDAVGANVFLSHGRTILIDWESIGPGPVGADLASLLFSSVRRGDASVGIVSPLIDDALESYVEGFRAEGADIERADVRRGFDAASALRWKLAVDVVSAIEKGEAPRRGSLPDEAPETAMKELTVLVALLLAAAGRALA
jgi:hypothetical protein